MWTDLELVVKDHFIWIWICKLNNGLDIKTTSQPKSATVLLILKNSRFLPSLPVVYKMKIRIDGALASHRTKL